MLFLIKQLKGRKNSVEVGEKRELRCKDMLYKLSFAEPIGDFHSHIRSEPELSKQDKHSMEIGDIEIVIAISKKKKTTHWKYNTNKKELSGVFGDFRFQIAAHSCYKSKGQEKKFEKIDLFCPFALGIGSKAFDITVPFPM